MYGRTSNGALSILTDARDEIQSKLEEAREALQSITDAIEQLEDAESTVGEAIDALEAIDGFSFTVEVDAFAVDVSVEF